MEVVKFFFTGMLVYILYKVGLTDNNFNTVYEQRTSVCKDCPLRAYSFCSKHLAVTAFDNKDLIKSNPTGYVEGCGCFLPFKKATSSECPLDKWEKFNGKNYSNDTGKGIDSKY